MDTVGAVLLAFAGALAAVAGVVGLAHIRRAWLRRTAMILYVTCLVVAVLGLPFVFEVTM